MKSFLEIARSEWAATRDALLDAFVLNTAETYYSKWFMCSTVANGAELEMEEWVNEANQHVANGAELEMEE